MCIYSYFGCIDLKGAAGLTSCITRVGETSMMSIAISSQGEAMSRCSRRPPPCHSEAFPLCDGDYASCFICTLPRPDLCRAEGQTKGVAHGWLLLDVSGRKAVNQIACSERTEVNTWAGVWTVGSWTVGSEPLGIDCVVSWSSALLTPYQVSSTTRRAPLPGELHYHVKQASSTTRWVPLPGELHYQMRSTTRWASLPGKLQYQVSSITMC